MKHTPHSGGFTLVEAMTTIFVASIFLVTIYNVYILSVASSDDVRRFSVANDLAYANLRKYANNQTNGGYSCPADGTSTVTVLNSDTTISGIPGAVKQNVTIQPIANCVAYSFVPALVTSTITYGPDNEKVAHAVYIENIE